MLPAKTPVGVVGDGSPAKAAPLGARVIKPSIHTNLAAATPDAHGSNQPVHNESSNVSFIALAFGAQSPIAAKHVRMFSTFRIVVPREGARCGEMALCAYATDGNAHAVPQLKMRIPDGTTVAN